MSDELRRLECLRRLELELRASDKSLRSFEGMPSLTDEQLGNVLAQYEHDINVDEHHGKVHQLNDEQRTAFNRFTVALEHQQPLILNLDAPGGTGRFFTIVVVLLKVLYVQARHSC